MLILNTVTFLFDMLKSLNLLIHTHVHMHEKMRIHASDSVAADHASDSVAADHASLQNTSRPASVPMDARLSLQHKARRTQHAFIGPMCLLHGSLLQ